jgi:hypothetical protein
MPELSAPADWVNQRALRVESISRTVAAINYQQAMLRLELNAFAHESSGFRKFSGSELALHLGESPNTVDSWITLAEIFCEHPAVVARVADGSWTVRHADALIHELLGSSLTPAQREEVTELVTSSDRARTPYEIRRATRAAILVIDPEAARARYEKIKDERSVTSCDNTDGSASLLASGTKGQIAQLMAGLDALCQVRQPGDDRPLKARRFDTLEDLVCGRLLPGQWTAYVTVDLAVLQAMLNPDRPDQTAGTAAPAVGGEIPGYGLITPAEAAELLEQATIRRAVVDEHGQLISLDSTTLSPDATPATAPVRLSTRDDVVEPTTVLERELEEQTLDGQGAPSNADRQWVHGQQEHDAEVAALTSHLEAELTALLTEPRFAFAGHPTPAPAGLTIEISSRHSGGGGGPPDLWEPDPPEPAAPLTWTDRDWYQQQLEAPDQSFTPEPPWRWVSYRPQPPAPRTPKALSNWTLPGLRRALTRLTTRPVDPRPLDSSAYALPPRLARHVKARDATCTFPGCHRNAQTCQSDHVVEWPLGKSTEHNIRSECTHHHQAKHFCFTVTLQPHGGLTWTTVTGHSVTRYPRPFLRGW